MSLGGEGRFYLRAARNPPAAGGDSGDSDAPHYHHRILDAQGTALVAAGDALAPGAAEESRALEAVYRSDRTFLTRLRREIASESGAKRSRRAFCPYVDAEPPGVKRSCLEDEGGSRTAKPQRQQRGGRLRPEELEEREEQFRRAHYIPEDLIDLDNVRVVNFSALKLMMKRVARACVGSGRWVCRCGRRSWESFWSLDLPGISTVRGVLQEVSSPADPGAPDDADSGGGEGSDKDGSNRGGRPRQRAAAAAARERRKDSVRMLFHDRERQVVPAGSKWSRYCGGRETVYVQQHLSVSDFDDFTYEELVEMFRMALAAGEKRRSSEVAMALAVRSSNRAGRDAGAAVSAATADTATKANEDAKIKMLRSIKTGDQ